MQTLLEVQECLDIPNGDEQKPTVGSSSFLDWEKQEGKAKTLLKMSVKHCIIPHIRECKSASEIWRILKDLYEIMTTNRVSILKSKILSLRMEENETVDVFIARIKYLKNKLAHIGETVADTDLVTISMYGVTDDYKMFITGINAKEKIPKFEELTGILMQEEEIGSNLKPQSADPILMAKKNFKGKGNPQQQNRENSQKRTNQTQGMHPNRNKSEINFFYCGKLDHIAKECRKKIYHEQHQKQKRHAGHLANENHVQNFILFMAEFDENVDADIWYVDSIASTHMMGNKQWFEYFKEINNGAQIYLGDDRSHQIKGCGKVFVILPNGTVRQIHNVVRTPVRALTVASLTIEELWHQRFGHINYNDLLLLQKKEMVRDLPMLKQVHNDCDVCTLGKMHREEFRVRVEKKQRDILELVHADLCGPMQTKSLGGALYFLLFIDDCTKFSWIYFLSKKSHTFEYFKQFRNMFEKQTGKHIKNLCSDQGGEYWKDELIKYFKDHEILQQFTVPHTPQWNGVMERKNRTLVECAKSMLKGKDISNGFWVEALNTLVYLKNMSPTKSLEFKTLYEELYGFKPVVKHLRVFGSKAFAHIPKEDKRKLNSKAIRYSFIGYCSQYKAYRLFNPSIHKIFVSRDVIFYEQDHEESDKRNEE
eukprot:PITA_25231